MGQAVVNLRRIKHLAGLPLAEAEAIDAMGEHQHHADGTRLFTQGEPMPGVFLVVQGALKLFGANGRGKVQIFEILRSGGCAGAVPVLAGGPAVASAEAHGDLECLLLPGLPLQQLAGRNPAVALWLIQRFAGNVRHLLSPVVALSLQSVPERVAWLILDQADHRAGGALTRFLETQQELAQRVGATRQAVHAALRLLEDLGLIWSSFPVVVIVDRRKLECFAQGARDPRPELDLIANSRGF